MLSSVLRSEQAIAVNVEIMRAFVRLRAVIASNAELAQRLEELERKALEQSEFDEAVREKFREVFEAIRALTAAPEETKHRPIGFVVTDD